jgi:hypothetical protein
MKNYDRRYFSPLQAVFAGNFRPVERRSLFLLSFPTPSGLATARLRLGLRRDERRPDEPGIQFFLALI